MTREVLISLGMLVFGGGLLALGMKLTLLALNAGDWSDARRHPGDDPVRLVTIEMLVNEVGRVLNTILIVVMGWRWIDTIQALPVGTFVTLDDVAYTIALVFLGMALLSVLQGFSGLFFRRVIIRAGVRWRELLRSASQ